MAERVVRFSEKQFVKKFPIKHILDNTSHNNAVPPHNNGGDAIF